MARGSLDVSLRALGGVRAALGQLRMATHRADDPIGVTLSTADGTPITGWTASRGQVLAVYGVPEEFQADEHSYRVKMRIDQEPDVEVFDVQGRLVWQSVAKTPRRHRGKVVQGPWRTHRSSYGP